MCVCIIYSVYVLLKAYIYEKIFGFGYQKYVFSLLIQSWSSWPFPARLTAEWAASINGLSSDNGEGFWRKGCWPSEEIIEKHF